MRLEIRKKRGKKGISKGIGGNRMTKVLTKSGKVIKVVSHEEWIQLFTSKF